MRTVHRLLTTGLLSLAALTAAGSSRADEIRVIASNAVKEAVAELTPAFEQRTGHRVAVTCGTTDIARRMESGEAFDMAIIPGPVIDTLVQRGAIRSGTRRDFAVRSSAPQSDPARRGPTSRRPMD
jgi:ABC-type molybdate transport system substrate-binding protein